MNTYEAYQYQTQRLTEEQKISLNVKENNVGRKLLPCEIVQVFNLEPTGEIKPKKRRMSDEVETYNWSDK
jgi:hypothetical protein